MSDAPSRVMHPDHYDATGDELVAFLDHKMKDAACPACSSRKPPMVGADTGDSPAHVLLFNTIYPKEGAGHASYVAFCQDCGHAWIFWANAVMKWVLEQRERAADNE